MFKIEPKIVNFVDYRDWDSFMKKEFPNCPYDSIVSEEEMRNGSTWSCLVGGDMSRADMEIIKVYLEVYLNAMEAKKDPKAIDIIQKRMMLLVEISFAVLYHLNILLSEPAKWRCCCLACNRS